MKNLLTPIFRLTQRHVLPLMPLSTINVPIEIPQSAPSPPPRPMPQRHKAIDDQQNTNQLSS